MTDMNKIDPCHLDRFAYVYIRQSTSSQVEKNRESTERQYKLTQRARALGWAASRIQTVDEDLAKSGATDSFRGGFEAMSAQVAMGRVGMILAIEVSRLARSNADWYRLLDLCSVTNTLIGDEDGVYHPSLFNDRLLLGLKGTMAEAELHVIRARLNGGIKNKAARGQLRRGLPIGFVWGEEDGEVNFHPDQAVQEAVRTIFNKFSELGSGRQVWIWFRSNNIKFPSQRLSPDRIEWASPTYISIQNILKNPVYAGAYVYGKTRSEQYVDEQGRVKKRTRKLPRSQWQVLIKDHHEGFIDWRTFEANQRRIDGNARPRPHEAGGAVREGAALLQGLATCGRRRRKLFVFYPGKNHAPAYYCGNSEMVNGRGNRCLQVGGAQIDLAVATAFLETIEPAGMEAALQAEKSAADDEQEAVKHWRRQIEKARYAAEKAERRYRRVEPENRLVARTLEAQWENKLSELADAEEELERRRADLRQPLTDAQRKHILRMGEDLGGVWNATTTTDRDKKHLLNILLEEVNININDDKSEAKLILRWHGGQITETVAKLNNRRQPAIRTDEDTLELVRQLAEYYDDATIAGVLNRQNRKTAHGHSFSANRVGNLRRHWKIPRHERSDDAAPDETVNVNHAAEILGVAPSTILRWLAEGYIAGEQITPGAPWRISITQELKDRFVEEEPDGYVSMNEAIKILGVSRQTVMQRVKRGELQTVHVRRGRHKGLRIKVVDDQPNLLDHLS
jgi:DNA invertase Pin-like site-specific DNA recombinase